MNANSTIVGASRPPVPPQHIPPHHFPHSQMEASHTGAANTGQPLRARDHHQASVFPMNTNHELDTMASQLNNLTLDPATLGTMREALNRAPLSKTNEIFPAVRTSYEGWILCRARPDTSEVISTWDEVTRERMHLPQNELATMVLKRKGKSVADKTGKSAMGIIDLNGVVLTFKPR
ncbi:predicted protein [Histoplasma capsulatum G186AR]|uniref:Uncharacterized protein n=1 Tax=Ajellomyces capsulatus (strain G186AR / H82 / ATCC MYA-2454 / RMSCC 2432) TaxID=447093 RepID=C0NFD5_AJECG|nr:uncharacterized protein HCBG_01601 [Histoplasma capsulatum G186AR]EEH09956.1 predicted protein [Histoplasma capsulatum G186AR]